MNAKNKYRASFSAKVIYRLAIRAYGLLLSIAALFHNKARLWVLGRKAWQDRLKAAVQAEQGEWIWLHAASLGEFEQGRPLLEAIRKQYPKKRILLSFFSPSGYEMRKKYQGADYVCYLPLDTPKNARIWMDILEPKMVFFVKYEFWYDYLKAIREREVPNYLVSGIFRPKQAFFKPWGGLFREMLASFELFFLQNEASANLLKEIGFENSKIAGDTRIDRVLAIKKEAKSYPIIEGFIEKSSTLVIGSSWAADEQQYLPFIKEKLIPNGWKIILAPHEVDEMHIQQLESRLEGLSYQKYSEIKKSEMDSLDAKLLIIDNIGMLSSLYAYAQMAYVGGGFGKGIHNILEAAVYQIPVLFGPKHKKFAEAEELLKLEVAFEVRKTADFYSLFDELDWRKLAQEAKAYFEQNKNATSIILTAIKPQIGENKA